MKQPLALFVLSLLPIAISPQAPPANMDVFDGCGLEGTAKTASLKALNRAKNRYTAPQAGEINDAITLKAMLAPGDDRARWKPTFGAELTGYVLDVKPGGGETCNCGKTDPMHSDTHIELVLDPADTTLTKSVVVEATPRLRAMLTASGTDWSTTKLRNQILHKWIKVQGWMTFDIQHANAAENTNPGGPHNWRATAWEIHPVTSIQVVPAPNP